jgi:hypothetical protein
MIGFDIISDLYLTPDSEFSWEGKATSLYCVIAGNISDDLKTIRKTLAHLGQYYQGVFYCLGSLEYVGCKDIDQRTDELMKLCQTQRNVVLLHYHVVVVENVAILGINGWPNRATHSSFMELQVEVNRNEDIIYLKDSLEKLQTHLDVRKILLVSNAVPNSDLYFGQEPDSEKHLLPIDIGILADTEHKVSHWAYGTYDKAVDVMLDNIKYINNSCYNKQSYWAKRVEI